MVSVEYLLWVLVAACQVPAAESNVTVAIFGSGKIDSLSTRSSSNDGDTMREAPLVDTGRESGDMVIPGADQGWGFILSEVG